jgi:hypothetical protein
MLYNIFYKKSFPYMNIIKHLLVMTSFCLILNSCGSSDETSFSGTWNGSFTELNSECPFTLNQNLGVLFPMTISDDGQNNFTVRAANGDIATGGQGIGEVISFTARANNFGNFGSTAPYNCTTEPEPYIVSYLGLDDTTADVAVSISFTNCTVDGGSTISCSAYYSGTAVLEGRAPRAQLK